MPVPLHRWPAAAKGVKRAVLKGRLGAAVKEADRAAKKDPALGFVLAVAMLSLLGIPATAGFIGKLMILQSVADIDGWAWGWTAILATTLIGVIGFARTGSAIFWKSEPAGDGPSLPLVARTDMVAPVIALLLLVALSAAAGPATAFMQDAAGQIMNSGATVRAVLEKG